jgi:hypothetical protein
VNNTGILSLDVSSNIQNVGANSQNPILKLSDPLNARLNLGSQQVLDASGLPGAAGQVLTSTGTATKWSAVNSIFTDPIAIGTQAGESGPQATRAIAVGVEAGQTNQATCAIAIGYQAGETAQGAEAIAIGCQAAQTNQPIRTIAIGSNAGAAIKADSISIGYQSQNTVNVGESGNTVIGQYSVAQSFTNGTGQHTAVGYNALQRDNAGPQCVAIGYNALRNGPSGVGRSVAVGYNTLTNPTSYSAVAVGWQAATTSTGNGLVAIGDSAGQNMGSLSVAIGNSAGTANMLTNGVAIGFSAGNTNMAAQSVAVGSGAGQTSMATQSVAIGTQAGQTRFPKESVAIGYRAGSDVSGGVTATGQHVIIGACPSGNIFTNAQHTVIGYDAMRVDNNQVGCVAIGYQALRFGPSASGGNSVTIGYQAGDANAGASTGPANGAVAVGAQAGRTSGSDTVSIGNRAGQTGQDTLAVAIGRSAGASNQRLGAIAIGNNAGNGATGQQQTNSIAIGNNSGVTNHGANSIAIGNQAALTTTLGITGTIVVNATGAALNPVDSSACYIAPIRQPAFNTAFTGMLIYNPTTSEVARVPYAYASYYGATEQPNTGAQVLLQYTTAGPSVTSPVGITLTGTPTTQLTVTNAGIYRLETSVQLDNSGANVGTVYLYPVISGTALANSTRILTLSAGQRSTFAAEFLLNLTATQYVEIAMYSTNTDIRTRTVAATGPAPVTPCFVTNIQRIA